MGKATGNLHVALSTTCHLQVLFVYALNFAPLARGGIS